MVFIWHEIFSDIFSLFSITLQMKQAELLFMRKSCFQDRIPPDNNQSFSKNALDLSNIVDIPDLPCYNKAVKYN